MPIYLARHGWHVGIIVRRADGRPPTRPEIAELSDACYVGEAPTPFRGASKGIARPASLSLRLGDMRA
jgi:hypothetical protein